MPEKCYINAKQIPWFFSRYFKRFDEELDQLRIGDGIKGRQQKCGAKFSRENNIKMILQKERQVYDSSGLGNKLLYTV